MLSWAHIGIAASFGAQLVGGCCARTVSRKTPIYFVWYSNKFHQNFLFDMKKTWHTYKKTWNAYKKTSNAYKTISHIHMLCIDLWSDTKRFDLRPSDPCSNYKSFIPPPPPLFFCFVLDPIFDIYVFWNRFYTRRRQVLDDHLQVDGPSGLSFTRGRSLRMIICNLKGSCT